ncbi:MAG: PDZ domain-containing protein, partial [bacterium]
ANLSLEEGEAAGSKTGVKVVAVADGSPAAEAGIQKGDIILKIGDNQIRNRSDFDQTATSLADSKEPLLFYIKRAGQPMFVAVEPGE